MNTSPAHLDGSRVVIVTQPVTTTVHDALTAAGYQPDTTTPNCVIYLQATNSRRAGADVGRSEASSSETAARRSAGTEDRGVGKLLLTPEEAAVALSIGRTKLYQLIRDGVLASILIGGSRRVSSHALAKLVAGLDQTPTLGPDHGPERTARRVDRPSRPRSRAVNDSVSAAQ